MKTATRIWIDAEGHHLMEEDNGTLRCETCGDVYRPQGMGDLADEVCDSDHPEHDWDDDLTECQRCGAPYPED